MKNETTTSRLVGGLLIKEAPAADRGEFIGKLYRRKHGAKFQYYTIIEGGLEVVLRTSARDYVACTEGGSFFFGRLDLIGAGDHGKTVKRQLEAGITPAKILYLSELDRQTASAQEFIGAIAELSGAIKGAAEALDAGNNSILKLHRRGQNEFI